MSDRDCSDAECCDDDDGFTTVVKRTKLRQKPVKYDTRSSCPSDACSSYAGQRPVMSFVRKVTDTIVLVRCKWCNCEFQIELKLLQDTEDEVGLNDRKLDEVHSKPLPIDSKKKKTEELVYRNPFDLLGSDDE